MKMKPLYDKTKDKLDSVENTLNISDVGKLRNVLSGTKSNLTDVLLMGNTLLVDSDVKDHVTRIKDRLEGVNTADKLVGEIHEKINDINTSGLTATKKHEKSSPYLDLVGGSLGAPGLGVGKNINRRFNEYEQLEDKINKIDIGSTIPTRSVELGATSFSLGAPSIDLNSLFNGGEDPNRIRLVDENGKEIKEVGGKYKVKIGGTEVEISGLKIDPGTGIMSIDPEFKVSGDNIDFSKPLSLNLMGEFDGGAATNYIKVASVKKFELTIDDPNFQDLAKRNMEFNNYNTVGGGTRIKDHLETRNELDLNKLEREAIERSIKDGDGPKYDQHLSEGQKEQFYQQIRDLDFPGFGGTKFFDHLESVGNFDDYNSFRTWFTHDDRDRNKGENISSKSKYRDFIHNNLESKSTEYISSQLDNEILKKHDINTFVKSELTKYLDEIEKNKVDSNIHTTVDSDLSTKVHQMDKGPWSMITPRDKNYMRFFSGSSVSLEKQKVNIDTNTESAAVNNPTPVVYDMKIEVGSTNRTSVSIDIEGEKKPIEVKAGDPTSLVRSVMKNQKIPHGKTRAHIAFNIYKAMIKMAQSKDISLNYRTNKGPNKHHLNEIDIDKNGNIVVYDLDDWTNRAGNTKRITEVLFDQKMFENTNDFNRGGYNGSLRKGIENISSHFNFAMNNIHKNYRKATKKRLFGMMHSPSRPKLPTSIWLSPIKKMMNFRTNTNFDFNTTVESNGNNISIQFEKNKFIVNMEGLEKPIESRDLSKVLKKRIGRKRIFDGMERDIVEGVYSAMIEKLRTNSKIARSNFGVTDEITGNMYILDSDGDFGVVSKEKLSQRNGNPLGRKDKKHGTINTSKIMTSGYEKLEEKETKELLKNPFVMQKMMKVINRRMGFGASMKAIFVK